MTTTGTVRTAIVAALAFVGLALPATAQAATNWAVVDSDGTLVRSTGVASATRVSAGRYVVTFDTTQANCAYVAVPGRIGNGAVPVPAVASVARTGDENALSIETYDEATRTFVDEPFHVMTYCGAAGRYAVVGRGGRIARGSHALSARRTARGEYHVHFDSDVSSCAFTASVGATGGTQLTAPGQIAVARARKPHNVLVSVVGAGGGMVSSPFHLAASCGPMAFRAVIKAGGTLARGARVTSSTRAGAGVYTVVFDQDVSACAYTATVGAPGTALSTRPLSITTASLNMVPDGVFLVIRSSAGVATDHGFHLVVRC
jgi:hypothetical protein